MYRLLFFLFLASCAHLSDRPRHPTSLPATIINLDPKKNDSLPLPPSTCPEGTVLQSHTALVDIKSCLKNYIHHKSQYGVARDRICIPPETQFERGLRLNPPSGKIYSSLQKVAYFPILGKSAHAALRINHAYYSLEWLPETEADSPNKETVKSDLQSLPLPKTVSLERCECDLKQWSQEQCLEKLGPLVNTVTSYLVEIM